MLVFSFCSWQLSSSSNETLLWCHHTSCYCCGSTLIMTSPQSPVKPSSGETSTCEIRLACLTCICCLSPLHMIAVIVQVCNHRFHNECLQRWGDLKCPVCRYCAQASSTTSHCTVCDTSQVRTTVVSLVCMWLWSASVPAFPLQPANFELLGSNR